ncbi:MAG TPA: trehalose-phosphatase [Rhizomicrobium sp.]|nr:trehalose-phosphatase [Rhizomicrobium sp.]
MLDVDGTLLDIASTPGGAIVPDGLRSSLERLSERARGAVALVSGRTLAEIDGLFAPLRLSAVGGHGAEIRPDPAGKPLQPAIPGLDPQLKQQIASSAAKIAGLLIEDKGYSLALHYRAVPEARPELETLLESALRGSKGVEILQGKSILEVKPSGYNKGTGVRELMKFDPFAFRMPIYTGDDLTDQNAFAAMPEFGGWGISVGHSIPGADASLESPAEVRRWVEWMGTP